MSIEKGNGIFETITNAGPMLAGGLNFLKNMLNFSDDKEEKKLEESDEKITEKAEQKRDSLLFNVLAGAATRQGGMLGMMANAFNVGKDIIDGDSVLSLQNAPGKMAMLLHLTPGRISKSFFQGPINFLEKPISMINSVLGVGKDRGLLGLDLSIGGPVQKAMAAELEKKEKDPNHNLDIQVVADWLAYINSIIEVAGGLIPEGALESIKDTFSGLSNPLSFLTGGVATAKNEATTTTGATA